MWLGEDQRGWDHVRIHVQLLRDGRVGAYHLAVYMGIAAHAELATGEAFPSARTLAGYGAMSERTVSSCLADLASWGYLQVVHRPGRASIFRLLAPPPIPLQHMQGSGSTPEPAAEPPPHLVPGTPAPAADEREPRDRDPLVPSDAVAGESAVVVAAALGEPGSRPDARDELIPVEEARPLLEQARAALRPELAS